MPRLEGPEDSYRKISKKALFRKVEQVVSDEVTNSMSINDTGALDMIPRFEKNEVISGRVVGRGGFCVVEEVTSLDVAPSDDESPRERMARLARTQNSGKYVIKQVTPGLFGSDKVTYLRGTIDLALEAHYLTSMNDKHIINLRGVAKIAPWEDLGYFLILDRLQETLSKRLNAWMHRKRSMGGISGIFCGSDRKKTSLLTERLAAAHDVAKAMDYLHSRNIIYRDLKPDNIGFDSNNILKIFDFGLAKELKEEEKDENGLYNLTGLTGGIRYMAPEVGRGERYNLLADVYSWSMLVWYIMALEPPLGMYTQRLHIDRVFMKGYRPAIKEKWPPKLSNLMRSCWSDNIKKRPDFKKIMIVLKELIAKPDIGPQQR